MGNTCVCGDVSEEHETTRSGFGACEVEGCDCILYEWDGEEGD